MSLRSLLFRVLLAKGLLNLIQRRAAFRGRLTFPEHHESLPAHRAMNFCITISALAKNLHLPASSSADLADSRD